jgi:hypothetical protein
LFQLHWVIKHRTGRFTEDYWLCQSDSQSYKSWAGYAFESICMKHIDKIVKALDVKAGGSVDSWRFIPRKHKENGAQIDLLIDRNDNAITICEIKYTTEPFAIDKQYAKNLQNKLKTFQEKTRIQKQLLIAIISANGMKETMYSEELISKVATLEDLFK